jgi:hypothetical protein
MFYIFTFLTEEQILLNIVAYESDPSHLVKIILM